MTRGSRQDVPSVGGMFIDYSEPKLGWKYWENRFEKPFSEKSRSEFRIILAAFNALKANPCDNRRLTRRDVERMLRAITENDTEVDPRLSHLIFGHTADLQNVNPNITLKERADYLLKEIPKDPEGFLPKYASPKAYASKALYALLKREGFNAKRLSHSTYAGMKGDTVLDNPPPAIEFIGRLIWHIEKLSLAEARTIDKAMKPTKRNRRSDR